jgi:hypothetical protein
MSVFNERQALEGLQRIDSQAISAIYDQYFSEVYRYVRYRIDDDRTAEDIASDVFVRLLEAAQKKTGPTIESQGLADRHCLPLGHRSPASPLSSAGRSLIGLDAGWEAQRPF